MTQVYLEHSYLKSICCLLLFAKSCDPNTDGSLICKDLNKDSKRACTIKVHWNKGGAFAIKYSYYRTSQVALVVKTPPPTPHASAGDNKRHGFKPWVEKIPWREAWQPVPVFLPGKSHDKRSLACYSLESTGSQRIRHYWSNLIQCSTA